VASLNLPVNVDTTYVDDAADPSVALHQQHHDGVHSLVNLFDYDAVSAATLGYYLYVDVATGLISLAPPLSAVQVNLQTGTAYTPVLADNGKVIEMSNAAANTVTIPAGVFTAGMQIAGTQVGAGTTSYVAGAGMTIRSRGGVTASAGQWADQLIRFRSASECVLSGDLA
jgi:hypothetical protein